LIYSSIVFAAVVALLAAPASALDEWRIEGRVVALADGDTLTVLDAEKKWRIIRIAGIDAPERRQPYGKASRENLSKLVYKRTVEAQCYKRDRYGREWCRVYRGSRDVGLAQVRAGLAWHYREFMLDQASQERVAYAQEEDAAKERRVGLWRDANPTPPWVWRR